MIDEIREQPHVLRRAIEVNEGPAEEASRLLSDSTHAIIAARGTSDNAARYAQYVWGTRNQSSVGLTTPSLFSVYERPPSLADALVVGISQSGQSPDIVSVLAEGRRQGRPTVAITNDPHSPLAAKADVVLELVAGEEKAVAATKTYTSQLALVALVSAIKTDGMESLAGIPAVVETVLHTEDEIRDVAVQFAGIEHCAVLGRGFNHSTAFEWALKLQELTYVVAQPFSTADFLHGPVAVVEHGYPVFGVAILGEVSEDVASALARAADAGGRVVSVTNDHEIKDIGEAALLIPVVDEWLSPIPAIVAGQLFAYHLTLAKGLDPETPRGLNKVTKTI
jgi:glucosamine--fructose-6-phosphate aminotransferase (isomerizing)